MKTCFKCCVPKPLSAFYVHPAMPDGHLGKCKECTKRDVRENRAANRHRYAAYERQRFMKPERQAQAAEYVRRSRRRWPQKFAARAAVSNALRDGRLSRQPCAHCGATSNVQAHHRDYSKPLEVEWLCFRCHREHEHGQTVSSGTERRTT